ncbi:DUF4129 domain-containing protein [Thalassiella azotivora]
MTGPLPGVVQPDADTAREWAREELTDPVYEAAEPGLLAQLLAWVWDALTGLEASGPQAAGVAVLLAVLAVLVLVVVRGTGSWRPGARRVDSPLDGPRAGTAAQHRARALAARDAGRFDEAVREWFRALARQADERALLTPRPGRTADEVAVELGRELPALADRLRGAAGLFDAVVYGSRPATAEDAEGLRLLDQDVTGSRPRPVLAASGAGSAGPGRPGTAS